MPRLKPSRRLPGNLMVAEGGDTEDNILRMEILDGLYEYERSYDELLCQV